MAAAIKRRKRYFCGCEGSGEHALLTALQRLCDNRDPKLPVYLERCDCKGGAPTAILEEAKKQRAREIRAHDKFDGGSFLFLDDDRLKSDGTEDKVRKDAVAAKFDLVVQIPRIEALLGRLIARDMSLGAKRAEEALKRAWADYGKNFTADDILKRIGFDQILLLQACADWRVFLQAIGAIPKKP